MARIRPALGAGSLIIAATLWAGAPAWADVDHDGDNHHTPQTRCQLAPGIKHIVEIQFDNVHLRRDNPNVPSDLEQMPNLLNFLTDNGSVLTNHHTPLISHTANDFITTLTGVYPEKHGQPVANSYGFFNPDGSVSFSSAFAYWTDKRADGTIQMIDQRGKVHPAPWVPFTRAGCDVGAFATANIEFENITTDIDTVFGPTSPEHQEAHNPATRNKAIADFEGIAIHCAKGSPLCAQNAAPDLLLDEPGSYDGFSALFGNVNVAPQINNGSASVNDLDGHPITDSSNPPNVGFPGFDPTPSQTLGYLATMLEAGVTVVYGDIADAHDDHSGNSGSFGPGEIGYVDRLASYDRAFGKFFARLKQDGITPENTIFIVTSDENDHFAGRPGQPANCDGVNIPCTYVRVPLGCNGEDIPCTKTNLGEVNADLRSLLMTEFGDDTIFSVHSDDAPTVYVNGQPGPTAPVTRSLEQNMANLLAFDPIKGRNVPLMNQMADPAGLSFLHMVTKDPTRTPTFTYFADDDFFLTASSRAKPCDPNNPGNFVACSNEQPSFNWSHGDFQDDITHTWLGLVGPGVQRKGETGEIFSDHTDVRPTVLNLVGLKDDYAHDGRVLFEVLDEETVPRSLREHNETLSRLAAAYKAINAPLGTLGKRVLQISTQALAGDTATYTALTAKIETITSERNTIAQAMNAMLENAAFDNQPIDENAAKTLIDEAQDLIASAQ
jgi:arylsulfatase A-like enzyme